MFDAETGRAKGLPQWGRLDQRQQSLVATFASLVATTPDPGAGPAMGRWLQDRAAVQASLDGLGLAVAGAFESSGSWGLDGYRSARCWLVDNTGSARIATSAALKTARLATAMPQVWAAVGAGELSADKVHWLARARKDEVAEVFDRDEAELVAKARLLSVDALRTELFRWHLRALEELGRNEPDGDPPLPEGEADRLNLNATVGGRGVIDGELDPASRAIVFEAIDAEIDGWFRRGELEDDQRTQAERNARAFLDIFLRGIAAGSAHGGPRPLLIATADVASLAELGILFDLHGLDPAAVDLSPLDLSALTPAPGQPLDLHAVIRAVLDLLLGGGPNADPDDPPAPPGPEPGCGPDGDAPLAPSPEPEDRPDADGEPDHGTDPVPAPPSEGEPGTDRRSSEADRPDPGRRPSGGPPPRRRPHGSAPPRHRRPDRAGHRSPRHRGPQHTGPPRSAPPPEPAHPVGRDPAARAPDRPEPDEPHHTERPRGTPQRGARAVADPLGPRRAEVVGVGPVPLRTIERLLPGAHVAFVACGPGGQPLFASTRRRIPSSTIAATPITLEAEPLELHRRQRLASNAQWRALLVRSGGTCEILGCPIPHQRCRAHHLAYWEHGGPTDLSNLLLVCTHHHATLHAGFTAHPAPHGGHQLRRPDRTVVPVPFRDRLPR